MAALRSSLPSRLRQLFPSEGSFVPTLQVDSEPPHKIKAFIDKVIQSPLQDIAIPLSGFSWEYNKGNFHHWRPLFHHFDTYFKTYLSYRNDLLLSDEIMEDDPFPKHAVIQILRVMQIIVENCDNKSSFEGLEHFKLLLASTDPEILLATLESLSALVKIHPSKLHATGKLIGLGSLTSCLLSLAQGWGSKEEGLGLYSCVVENEKCQEEGLSLFPSDVLDIDEKCQYRLGSTLYFELHGFSPSKTDESSGNEKTGSSSVIQIPDLHLRKEEDLKIMKHCIEEYNVSTEQRFSLLTRIRYANAFSSRRTCRLYSRICLLSFIVLVQSNDANDELVSFFANEPEYTNELIKIVRSEETISGTIRTLAMFALTAQLGAFSSSHDRARILGGSNVNIAGGNRMVLLNVLQKAILSLSSSNDPSSVTFVEALLQFYRIHVISSSSSGSFVRGSGVVSTLFPLLENSDSSHIHLVCYAVKTLQKLMDYSNTAVTLFKDLGGVELLTQRLQVEVQRVLGVGGSSDTGIPHIKCSSSSDDCAYSQRRFIKALLKALGAATYAPANSSRSLSQHDSSLPSTLSLIFSNVNKFGGDVYCGAVTVMSEILHKDPTCYTAMHEMGLPEAFLSSVVAGVFPSPKALTCVPSGLGAICLNNKGLEAVKEASALRILVDIFTSRKYVVFMNEVIVSLSNGIEELLRHVSTLRGTGVDIIIEIVNKITSIADGMPSGSPEKANGSTAMDMDPGGRNNSSSSLVSLKDSPVEGINDQQFINFSIFHAMVLIHRTMENTETCRLFVRKLGIDALLKLLLRTSIIQSSEGMAIALHSTLVFKGFTQHHSTQLVRSFCVALREHLKKALIGFSVVSGSFLLNPRTRPDAEVFSPLFVVEFLLLLAASKDNRWTTSLLTEFGGDSKDVLEDIGSLHREILWQISLLEDAKVEVEEDSISSSELQVSASASGETNDQRWASFRQFLDPLLRRRMSGWNTESHFFDLINLYRDLGRTSGVQQRCSLDAAGVRSGNNSQLNQTGSSDVDAVAKNYEDEQRKYYTSCCDMMRSLSLHIVRVFQELGKAMLLPSRRRDDTLSMSPSSKSLISTFSSIALEHMNFGGHRSPSGSEAEASSKCRYFGKVIDFIDGILMDRNDSCNPIVLNCLYAQGVIQSVLTTFQATSQLLFTINQTCSSPMEADDGSSKLEKDHTEHSWIYSPLASYGKLMDHLVTSSYILSPFTKHLLVQPVASGCAPFPKDAETFVKVLQSMVLKNVLPVWNHPQFVDCSNDFITEIISIIRHVYSGVDVKNFSSSTSARVTGPPPNETSISTIVEMGFSRARAEEVLRQVGANSVELAMDWLFSHPEETQKEDELARALAMSLGNAGTDLKEDADLSSQNFEEEMTQLPSVDQLLLTCVKVLQLKDPLAFPVKDLLMVMCSQNDGQNRSNVISFIIEQMKECTPVSDARHCATMSALFHVLALILHEDPVSREVAVKNGFVELASDLLWKWDLGFNTDHNILVPKWIAAAFLALDCVVQVDRKLDSQMVEQLKKFSDSVHESSIVISGNKQNKAQLGLDLLPQHLDFQQQKKLIQVAISCIRKQLPSETIHAVLQLCTTLTRDYRIAVSFLEAGGLLLLLNLQTSSLFTGFDKIAAFVIRHILEDPQTLQLIMESEIKNSIITAINRHSSGRLAPRSFLSNLSSVITRDPLVFMRAAQSVCQVEMVGDRPYIVLLKDREKDKGKDKEKEKDKTVEKDKVQSLHGKAFSSQGVGTTVGQGKLLDSNSKSFKSHRRPPASFVSVIELLLDSVVAFEPPVDNDVVSDMVREMHSALDVDVDVANSKGKGKAVASASEDSESNTQESASIAKIVFILKLLTEIMMRYSASGLVLLRKDAEVSGNKVSLERTPGGYLGGIFHHLLHKFVPQSKNSKKEKKVDSDWKYKLASTATQFMVATCVRSAEARKRVFVEINSVFSDFVESADVFRSPSIKVQACTDLLNDVLGAQCPNGAYVSVEAASTFVDVGLVRSLTRTLQVLDLEHFDSSKFVAGVIKALEVVTKEHVAGKSSNLVKASERNQHEDTEDADIAQPREIVSEGNINSASVGQIEPFNVIQTFGGSESLADDMEHDQDHDGGNAAANEDDYMHDTGEDARGLEDVMDSVSVRYELQPEGQENLADEDDDDDMCGDDGDEDEHNDLEEEEGHQLQHPDTDQDDNEIDDGEFDEEVLEEDDEEDEDDEDGVILQLEEGINGINVFDHIEVFGRDRPFSNETLRVMPVDLFGSGQQGRSASIYSLLGGGGGGSISSQHPLLVESCASLSYARAFESVRDTLSEQSLENPSSRLDNIFRSLRTGRQGYQFNLWLDDNQSTGAASASALPQGLEDLIVTRLRQPNVENSDDVKKTATDSQSLTDAVAQTQGSKTNTRSQEHLEANANNQIDFASVPFSASLHDAQNTENREGTRAPLQGTSSLNMQSNSIEMQFEPNDSAVRDVEAVSQESGGSGATVGESLRSLDVEIGSTDGHDEGGERQGPGERMPLNETGTRLRRISAPIASSAPNTGREVSLNSVTEVAENPILQNDPNEQAVSQQLTGDEEPSSIDPAFLEALPEELRAEVLQVQQGQAAQPSSAEQQNTEDIDPEFLAALPPDIRAEVLAQQQAQRLHQSQELEGQPVEMDTVSIIATFPSDLREEVLLTSSDAVLANLTPALVAEANMLRERFANRYHRTLFGAYPRSRRGESSRRGPGSSLDRIAAGLASHRSSGGRLLEVEGDPLVDTDALKGMIRLFRVVQPLYKSQLQRLLLNLCAHNETRTALVKILMDMLMLNKSKDLDQLSATEPSYRLYACNSHVMYSRPQYFYGVPPLVSRRVLETLTYLARNHSYVAKLLLECRLPYQVQHASEGIDRLHGKTVMLENDNVEKSHQQYELSVALLLGLLNQPRFLRSIVHLEQLLNLLDVIIDNATSKFSSSDGSGLSHTEQQPQPQILSADTEMSTDGGEVPQLSEDLNSGETTNPSTSDSRHGSDAQNALHSLPHKELRLLCSLLAKEGLSDQVYAVVAEILKKLAAVATKHTLLFITELTNSVQKLWESAMKELHMFAEGALLQSTSSDGASILRVLQALSSLVSSLKAKEKDEQAPADDDHQVALRLVRDINGALEPLWSELSSCIGKIENSDSSVELASSSSVLCLKPSGATPPLIAGSQNVLPYIEAFFVTCERISPVQANSLLDFAVAAVPEVNDASTSASKEKVLYSSSKGMSDEKHIAFIKFTERHRKLLNAFIRQNPGLLEKSFSLLLKFPRFIDFDNKRSHFRTKIKHQHDRHHSSFRISVKRAYILEDSYYELRKRSAQELKGRLTVHFQGEAGIDAGGLTREWYQLLCRVIFDKGALLFTTVGSDSTFQPNPNSVYQTEHLSYFKFVGRVVGKALFDGQLLDVHFTRSFYKHILGEKVTYHDIEAIDPDYYKNLKWMLENDISDVLDLTFSIDADEEKLILYERSEVTDYELIPGGRNIKVTEENKHQYVDLIVEHRLTTAIRPQINAFLEGFNELIPRDLISIFNNRELELLISGLPDIDLDDLRANTEYSGYSPGSPVIQWFWEIVQSFSKEDKARLLQFVTGTSKVPLEGFSALPGISGTQKFQIYKAYGSIDHLPSAHTCFNQLDLPEYPSKQHLQERLLLAIHEGNEGFGFG